VSYTAALSSYIVVLASYTAALSSYIIVLASYTAALSSCIIVLASCIIVLAPYIIVLVVDSGDAHHPTVSQIMEQPVVAKLGLLRCPLRFIVAFGDPERVTG
jgi:hypothetical protein